MESKKDENKKDNDINFEDAMEKLELIAEELEKDDLTLDKSVSKFEEGMELSKRCSEILENAEKRITILLDGSEENFTPKED